MPFVVDASIALSWLMPDERDESVDALASLLAEGAALVPDLFMHEVRNALVVAHRRGRIERDRLVLAASKLRQLPVKIAEPAETGEVLDYALMHDLSAYDAAYLALACRTRLPLATRDSALRRAARLENVPVLP
ncbi:type II toxin-antitoxin system VapC family toxin [Salinarimonas ramus]|uniref:Ribonuclease VapC n=1 Tax=Salinarimonas ramus TaxID=690164 RepID=A0A917Q5J2_9HYPH|nr:type II toxin-antitoxin system VapC family toxin [Salinarimonas ramus]GGK26308.1 ribonuclease VapC [Salinarimonas ramus]